MSLTLRDEKNYSAELIAARDAVRRRRRELAQVGFYSINPLYLSVYTIIYMNLLQTWKNEYTDK